MLIKKLSLSFAIWFVCCQFVVAKDFFYDNGVGGAPFVTNGIGADDVIFNQQADNLTLDSDVVVTEIEWTGTYSSSQHNASADNFTIEFYADNGNLPMSPAFAVFEVGNEVNRLDSGFNVIQNIYEYSVAIDGIRLNADTTYWISITNNTAGGGGGFWFWGTRFFEEGDRAFSFDMGETWGLTNNGHDTVDFRLRGIVVPEPSGLTVLFAALFAGLTQRRRTA